MSAQQATLQETLSAIEIAKDELRVLTTQIRQKTLDGLRRARE